MFAISTLKFAFFLSQCDENQPTGDNELPKYLSLISTTKVHGLAPQSTLCT